jgi:hypothetical protein
MSESRAARTLVKSPPELWSEVSSAASLNRHMDQFGEIRITRLEPETAVAWEGEHARGTVRLEPSGWGTRVSLTAEPIEPGAPVGVAGPLGPVSAMSEREAEARAAAIAAPVVDHAAALGPPYATVEAEIRELTAFLERSRREAEKRRWTRRVSEAVRRWFRAPLADGEVEAAFEADPVEPVPAPEPAPPPGPEVAEASPETEVPLGPVVSPSAALSAVLDSLGQAHHRPFSRP